MTTRVNICIDVHDMTHATVGGNTGTFRLVDGNPRITWNKCPQGQRLAGAAEWDTLDADVSIAADEGPRGSVIGEPPPEGIENLRINDAGTGFVGTATGSDFRVWGGDLDSLGATHIAEMVDNFRDVRRMGANVIRLLIDTEDVVVQPTCTGCPVGVDQAAGHAGAAAPPPPPRGPLPPPGPRRHPPRLRGSGSPVPAGCRP